MSPKLVRTLKGIGLCLLLFVFSGAYEQGDLGSKPRYLGKTAEGWIAELAGDKARRQMAFDALVTPRREATPVLLELLVNQNASIRCVAAMGLCHIGSKAPEAIPYLVIAIQDRHLNTRYWAIQALAEHGPVAEAAVPTLVKVLQETFWEVDPTLDGPKHFYADARAVAARCLGEIGKGATPAIPALQEALTDKSPDVRDAAAKALLKIEREANK